VANPASEVNATRFFASGDDECVTLASQQHR
jgi:hypothetical protein